MGHTLNDGLSFFKRLGSLKTPGTNKQLQVVNTQKCIAVLYTINEQVELEFLNTPLLVPPLPKMK